MKSTSGFLVSVVRRPREFRRRCFVRARSTLGWSSAAPVMIVGIYWFGVLGVCLRIVGLLVG